MTQCKTRGGSKQVQMALDFGAGKPVEVRFDGDCISSDGGLMLLRKADDKLELTKLASWCLGENRRPDLVKHKLVNLLSQRIYGIAAGYEDCNDAAQLATDGMHKVVIGLHPASTERLASQPTLSRWENSVDETALKALQKLLVHTYIRSRKKRPMVIRLAMDTSCDRVHGYQQLSFYNGFYEEYCFTPLFIFDDDGFPLAALLRHGNAGPGEYGKKMVQEVVHELRLAWPNVRIELTADAGFCTPEIYDFCEQNEITYYIGIKSNHGFKYHSSETIKACKADFDAFGFETAPLIRYGEYSAAARQIAWRQREERIRFSSKEEGRQQEHFEDDLLVRKYMEFNYDAREWTKTRRIIARCDYDSMGPDIRYVITNSKDKNLPRIYESKYCRRARCENWIKDLKTYLKCDRTSCQEFSANQFRLLLHTFAYILLREVGQQAGLKNVTAHTLQLRLIKVAVLVKETARRIWVHVAQDFPWRREYQRAWFRLSG